MVAVVSHELPGADVPRRHPFHETGVDVGEGGEARHRNATVHSSGKYVPVGDVLVPEWLELVLVGDEGHPDVDVRVEVRDGAPRVVRLAFTAPVGRGEVRQRHLRAVQVDALMTLLAGYSVQVTDDPSGGARVTLGVDHLDVAFAALQRQRGRRTVTPELLQQVADVYLAHVDGAPTEAVGKQFFVSKRQATNYIKAAERAGLLPPTTRGKKRGTK